MIIAVNTRLPENEQPEGFKIFMYECLNRITKKYPQHTFIYIFDKLYNHDLIIAENIITVVAGPEIKNTLLRKYWYNYKIPALLRKHKAEAFVSMDGICSLRTKIPQCLMIKDLGFLIHPEFLKRLQVRFYKKFTPEFLAKAKSIVTVSAYAKTIIVEKYKIAKDKVEVVYFGIDEKFKPLNPDEKEIIKEKFTNGKAYFLFSGNMDEQGNLINLLKAFSFFKKRQKSNMLLVIAGKPDESFLKNLKTFKFRNEVIVLYNLPIDELAKITAAAYALVYPVLYTDFAMAPLQAMQSEVPVITSNVGALPSLFGEAALYARPDDFKDLAENMMLIFKDENKAKDLVKAGKIQAQQYQWDKTAALFWQSIQKTINN